ncbi:alcohol acetyltransferase [Nostoc sp. UHCC 0702]|nr:alcohol acetyltransferase [Nostoc sp. UHCC 0702]
MVENRKLGCLEQCMEVLNNRAKTWNIVTISRIKGPLNEGVLRQALEIIHYRHLPLNSHIVSDKKSLYFRTQTSPNIDLRVVKKVDSEQWQEIVSEEMNQAIDSKKGLLRVVLVHILSEQNISYLITTAHHAIADGLSSTQLHSEILTYCDKTVSGELIHPVDRLSPLPAIEELLPTWAKGLRGKVISIYFLLKMAFNKLRYQPQTLGFEKYTAIANRNSNILHQQLDQELTQKLVTSCKRENTTVQSALCAAMMLTVMKKIIKGSNKEVRVNCLSYFDLRRHLTPAISDEHMTVLASSLMQFHTIPTNVSFWELAREVKQKLETGIKQGDIFKMILLSKYLIDFCFIFPKQVAATVSVSNIGKVNIPKIYGEFELEEISFAGSHALYSGIFITHASTFQGKMLLNFVFSEPSISLETMKALVKNFVSYIDDACI